MTLVHLDNRRAAAKGKLDVRVMTITPEIAETWLAKNTANRNISRGVVEAYARDMTNGTFVLSNDAVAFDVNGTLLNSQHRLLACVKSGKSFESIVVEGMQPESRNIMDTGLKRKLADAFQLSGHSSALILAGSISWLNRIKLASEGKGVNQRMTTPEGVGILDRHPRIEQSISAVGGGKGFGIATRGSVFGPPPTLAIAMHYVGANMLKAPDLADKMIGVFRNGESAYKGDPCLLWRERLLRHRMKGESLTRETHLSGMAHCWNLFSKRRRVEQFRIPEQFCIEGLDARKI